MGKPNQVSVVITTLNRPDRIKSTWQDLYDKNVKLWYVCHQSDEVSQKLVKKLGANLIIDDSEPKTAIKAMNCAFAKSDGDWVALCQDDFKFHPYWLEEALKFTDTAKVIGFNDCAGMRHGHSVGWLVKRDFVNKHGLAIGYPGYVFAPGYSFNWCDDELNETARYRGVWAYAENSRVEHMHHSLGKATKDQTNIGNEHFFDQDHQLYLSRKYLWT